MTNPAEQQNHVITEPSAPMVAVKQPMERLSAGMRFALDFSPLAVFFIGYRLHGLMLATALLIALTLISLAVTYWKERKIAPMPLVTGVIVAVFGSMTLILQDEQFIKMKPTIVNALFSSLLLGGVMLKKPLLKWVLGYAISLEEKGWMKLSFRWGLYFAFLALLNEYIWRNYPTDFWVDFKVFGMLALTVIFTLLQLPLMKRYLIEDEPSP